MEPRKAVERFRMTILAPFGPHPSPVDDNREYLWMTAMHIYSRSRHCDVTIGLILLTSKRTRPIFLA